ncbi:MAG: hypothetical protein GC181_08670 [Bacteroidetes bacterium]|nr:hypothetical protein [Bacteroidota bacterium]
MVHNSQHNFPLIRNMNNFTILDESETAVRPKVAKKISRLVNYVIDTTCIMLILGLLLGFIFAFNLIDEDNEPVLVFFLFWGVMMSYFTVFEFYLSKTPGKLISKTHVITINGDKPTFLNILGRSLCRFIPLDNISLLFSDYAWHDEVSNTMVVQDEEH